MIRLSQWAEIRQLYFADHIPKKQIARRSSDVAADSTDLLIPCVLVEF